MERADGKEKVVNFFDELRRACPQASKFQSPVAAKFPIEALLELVGGIVSYGRQIRSLARQEQDQLSHICQRGQIWGTRVCAVVHPKRG
jgi:hypothetical protein